MRKGIVIGLAMVMVLMGFGLSSEDVKAESPGPGIVVDGVLHVPSEYGSIQGAIDAASPGDTISVAAGTYAEYLHITTDDLTIVGAGIGQSIIDPDGLEPYWHYSGVSKSFASRAGVYITGYGSPDEIVEDVIFKGFTVKNVGLNPPTTATGTHTGSDNVAVLTDSSASWVTDVLVGQWLLLLCHKPYSSFLPHQTHGFS